VDGTEAVRGRVGRRYRGEKLPPPAPAPGWIGRAATSRRGRARSRAGTPRRPRCRGGRGRGRQCPARPARAGRARPPWRPLIAGARLPRIGTGQCQAPAEARGENPRAACGRRCNV